MPVAVREPAITQLLEPTPPWPAEAGSSVSVRACPTIGVELGAQQLGFPVVRQVPGEEDERRGVGAGVLGDRRLEVEELVLDGLGGHRIDPRGDPLAEAAVHSVVLDRPVLDRVPLTRPIEPDGPGEDVVVVGELAEALGETTRRGAQQQIELEEPFPGGDESLREPQVVERLGGDPRNPVGITLHRHRSAEPGSGQLAFQREQRCLGHRPDRIAHLGQGTEALPS